jgi:uncharacterized protein
MKSMRMWDVALLGLVLAVAPVWVSAEKVATMPAPTGYVDDYAGVLSGAGKTELEDLCREVHDKTKAQVFFVTVKTLDGEAVETFANELFAKWKIGEKKTDRGVLLVLAIAEHKRWIEVGYGLEGILNDAKVGDIGREMVPELKAAKYDDAARTGVRGVSKVIAADAGVAIDGLEDGEDASSASGDGAAQSDTPSLGVPSSKINKGALAAAVDTFIFLTLGILGAFVWWRSRTSRRGNPGAAWFGSSGSSSDSDSGSSFGSGGSDDSFSGGDGGSSGGGGAGGDW